jgi:hypothetical protein
MKSIWEQFTEQARAIRARWAKVPAPDGSPRHDTIRLVSGSKIDPGALERRMAVGVSDRNICGVPAGHLVFSTAYRGWSPRGDGLHVVVILSYRERPWAELATPSRDEVVFDASGRGPYRPCDFDALLDALEPPAPGSTGPAADPGPGSWRDRPALL